jgi:hypothetical protein
MLNTFSIIKTIFFGDEASLDVSLIIRSFAFCLLVCGLEIHSAIENSDRELDVQMFELDDTIGTVGAEAPSIIFAVVDLYPDAERIDNNVFLYRGMGQVGT